MEVIKAEGLCSFHTDEPRKAHFSLKKCGCLGCCELGPRVRIDPYDILYAPSPLTTFRR